MVFKNSNTLFLFTFLISLSFFNCNSDISDKNSITKKETSKYLNHGDSANYVGMNTCKLCHQSIYNSFIKTGMGKSFDLASKSKSSADFSKPGIYDKAIRYSDRFKLEGTNVNFIQKKDEQLFVRTYERGVENETLSCGTGVTAAALVASILGLSNNKNNCLVKTMGGNLEVSFEKVLEKNFYNIWLKGFAVMVYKSEIMLP